MMFERKSGCHDFWLQSGINVSYRIEQAWVARLFTKDFTVFNEGSIISDDTEETWENKNKE